MRKSLFAPIAALLLTAGIATAGSVSFKDSTGATVSIATFTANGLNYYLQGLIDTTGAQIDPATKQAQMAVQSAPGTSATTATGIQGVVNGIAVATANPSGQAAAGASATAPFGVQGVAGGMPVNMTPLLPQLTATDIGGSFGTTAAQLAAVKSDRHFLQVQVQGAPVTAGTNGCYINGSTTATQDYHSLFIPRGSYFESATHVGIGAISIICSATMQVYARQG